ncbi:MAG: RHS repeat-associated core domain-containing protein, partial [Ktedonobacteraceae bacterium]|nr:RHS repeat-associated core domain-containing protein [Ktedonobacteraceae bacterium]
PNPYAAYDAMGNMTCRDVDPTSGHTCGTTPTGAQMTYDVEGRLASWTAPSGTTSSINYLYDNEGNRVLQHQSTTTGGTTTTTDTVTFDSYTETVITGGTTLTTQFYSVAGQRVAMKQGNALYYLLGDILGSVSIVLKDDGTFQAAQLFAPYGTTRYTQGTMPTTYNFTGQRLDSQTGLLYYNSRYYDPVVGRFARADTKQTNGQGMDPYAYVGGDPETKTDPTGHMYAPGTGGGDVGPHEPARCNACVNPVRPKDPNGSHGHGTNPCAEADDPYMCSTPNWSHQTVHTETHRNKGASFLRGAAPAYIHSDDLVLVGVKGLQDFIDVVIPGLDKELMALLHTGQLSPNWGMILAGLVLSLAGMFTFGVSVPIVATGFSIFAIGATGLVATNLSSGGDNGPVPFSNEEGIGQFITGLTLMATGLRDRLATTPYANTQVFVFSEYDTYKSTQQTINWGHRPYVVTTTNYDVPDSAQFMITTYNYNA